MHFSISLPFRLKCINAFLINRLEKRYINNKLPILLHLQHQYRLVYLHFSTVKEYFKLEEDTKKLLLVCTSDRLSFRQIFLKR